MLDADGLQLPQRRQGVLHDAALAPVPFEGFDQVVGLQQVLALSGTELFGLLDQGGDALMIGLGPDLLALTSRSSASANSDAGSAR
jgi:hypothetical protein